jgi:histidinol dehydrogenase
MKTLLPFAKVTRYNYKTVAARIRRRPEISKSEALTRRIIEKVRRNGERAVLEYTERFDGISLRKGQLRISEAELKESTRRVDPSVMSALRLSLQRVEALQNELLSRINYSSQLDDFTLELAAKPLPSVGCYIPGGKAAYPSTVLMTAGVAKLAGVPRIAVCTPPNMNGTVDDTILAAADLCGVDEVYRCGGAQAIAALAYGTKTIPRVEKIVGPGGAYVAIAKKLVSGDVPIDFYAGPTELVVVADKTSNTRLAAWDLIAQAEHGPDTLPCLVTWSNDVAAEVRSEIRRILPRIERKKYVEKSLANGAAAICEDKNSACDFVNEMAPEHVELLTECNTELSEQIRNAGIVLTGPYSPAAASDYYIGSNHVLPTGRFARSHGGLSVLDFIKLIWTVTGSSNGLQKILEPLRVLASSEGLPNHYSSVQARFEK